MEYVSPLWMGSGDRVNLEYILYIIHYQTQTHMVHIYSQKHSEAMYVNWYHHFVIHMIRYQNQKYIKYWANSKTSRFLIQEC